jgi:DNA-binding transcriptional regulator YiaG
MTRFGKIDGNDPGAEPLHYRACGLDDVYLVNGFTREIIDGEEYLTIEDLDGLWKAIGLQLVTEHKVLAPKQLRFLRDQMDLTQAELGARLRVSDQTVARWEKGQGNPGPADIAIRVLYLASKRAQPEGCRTLRKLTALVDDLVDADDDLTPVVFKHGQHRWSGSHQPIAELV